MKLIDKIGLNFIKTKHIINRNTGLHANRWPSLCLTCHTWSQQILCHNCTEIYGKIFTRCSLCALVISEKIRHTCLPAPLPWLLCYSRVDYTYPWREIIFSFKYHAQLGLAPWLAQLILQDPNIEHRLQTMDYILVVPSSEKRIYQRGYNQCVILARAIKGLSKGNCKLIPDAVLKMIHTKPQAEVNLDERVKQLKGVFQIDPRYTNELRHKHILLLDDVMTSGATMLAVATCIQKISVKSLVVLSFARTAL